MADIICEQAPLKTCMSSYFYNVNLYDGQPKSQFFILVATLEISLFKFHFRKERGCHHGLVEQGPGKVLVLLPLSKWRASPILGRLNAPPWTGNHETIGKIFFFLILGFDYLEKLLSLTTWTFRLGFPVASGMLSVFWKLVNEWNEWEMIMSKRKGKRGVLAGRSLCISLQCNALLYRW